MEIGFEFPLMISYVMSYTIELFNVPSILGWPHFHCGLLHLQHPQIGLWRKCHWFIGRQTMCSWSGIAPVSFLSHAGMVWQENGEVLLAHEGIGLCEERQGWNSY